MKRTYAYIHRWGLVLLSLLTLQHSFSQSLKSEDNTSTNVAELRVEANFTKHFKLHNQGINLYFSEAVFSSLYESTYSQLEGQQTDVSPYFRRSYTTLGLNYAPIPYLRIGTDYTLKLLGNKLKAGDGTANPANEFLKHRISVYMTGQYTIDEWKFSLREKLDANIRTDSVNLHEKPQTALYLRHKVQAQYTIPGKPLKVYTYIELWNTLNQPVKYLNTYARVNQDGIATAYAGKTFGQYLSEIRAQAGLSWRVDKCNSLNLAYRFTYGYSRDINITHSKSLIELTHAKSYEHVILFSYDLDW